MSDFSCDVVIMGGGIAGLWALHVLKARGYDPVLVEKHTLGGVQTLAAQGILHGGMKYALDGKVDDIASRLREMPPRWLASMAGSGEVDLREVKVLSPHQLMWSDRSLWSKLSAAVGSKMLKGDVESLDPPQWPEVFPANDYKGSVRMLKETVLDIKSVVEALARPVRDRVFRADQQRLLAEGDQLRAIELSADGGPAIRLHSKLFLFTAGAGNETPGQTLPFAQPVAQRRPLKQVLIRGVPWKLWGHCIVADPKPRVTVTSHTLPDGTGVWYLGGNVAEKAVAMTDEEALAFACREMTAIFPKTDWKQFGWAVWPVDRAEPHQASRFLPAEPTVTAVGNCLLAWPTKLVFAPGLATKLAQEVADRLPPSARPAPALPLPPAEVGLYPWERISDWRNLR